MENAMETRLKTGRRKQQNKNLVFHDALMCKVCFNMCRVFVYVLFICVCFIDFYWLCSSNLLCCLYVCMLIVFRLFVFVTIMFDVVCLRFELCSWFYLWVWCVCVCVWCFAFLIMCWRDVLCYLILAFSDVCLRVTSCVFI